MKYSMRYSFFGILICFNLSCDTNDFHQDLNHLAFRIIGFSASDNQNVISCEFYNLDAENRSIDLYVYPKSRERLDKTGYKYTFEVQNIKEDFVLENIADGVDYICVLSYKNENQIIESEEFVFNSTINNSPWKRYEAVNSHSDDYHDLFLGNGTIYYFSGSSPVNRFKWNAETMTFDKLDLSFHHHFVTYKDKPYFLNFSGGGKLKTINENNESIQVAVLDSQPKPLEIDFEFEYNDKAYFNNKERIFEIDFNADYLIAEVGSIPIDHFGPLDKFYIHQNENTIYFLVPENSGGSVYSLDIENFDWKFETTYPGTGAHYFWFTGEENKLLVGGGATEIAESFESRFKYEMGDFWTYDIPSGTWDFEGFMPYQSNFVSSNVVKKDGKHFFLTSDTIPLYKLTSFDFRELR